jgi:F-type H+-transporting ATPase subunit b
MPQFRFGEVLVPQLVWLAVFFLILYFGIVKLTLPRIGRVMNEREGVVTGDLSAAEAAKAEADRIRTAYDADIGEAQARARSALNDAKTAASRSVEARLGEVDATLNERQRASDEELAAARGRALGEIEGVAAETAATIVERLIGDRPEPQAAADAARRALAEA